MSDPAQCGGGGFNCDRHGNPSTMRWISFILALGAVLLAANEAALMWYGKTGNVMLVLYFLGAATGGKVIQKAVELRETH